MSLTFQQWLDMYKIDFLSTSDAKLKMYYNMYKKGSYYQEMPDVEIQPKKEVNFNTMKRAEKV